MAVSFKQISYSADKWTDLICHGYIKRLEKLSRQNAALSTSSVIIYTCIMYYGLYEYFDVTLWDKLSRSDDGTK